MKYDYENTEFKSGSFTAENFQRLIEKVSSQNKPAMKEFVEFIVPTKLIMDIEDDDSFDEIKKDIKNASLVYLDYGLYDKVMSYYYKRCCDMEKCNDYSEK